MILENINNDKFKKLEKYQEDNLDAIKGGEESNFTLWWNDTNMSTESNSTIDVKTSYWKDATSTNDDGTNIKDDIQPYPSE